MFHCFDSFENAKNFYNAFLLTPKIFCTTGSKVLKFNGSQMDITTLVDFIFLDGFFDPKEET